MLIINRHEYPLPLLIIFDYRLVHKIPPSQHVAQMHFLQTISSLLDFPPVVKSQQKIVQGQLKVPLYFVTLGAVHLLR